MDNSVGRDNPPVSYTHLDVYKRQGLGESYVSVPKEYKATILIYLTNFNIVIVKLA